jgi:probable biosynthetic protein (TIGR04098 family)
MTNGASHETLQDDVMDRVDQHTIHREVTVKPGMCGHNALLVGQIGDWTWDAVSRLCGINAFRAADDQGNATYLAFYFYQILGDRSFHPRSASFGDRVQVVSTCYGFGAESVLTLHRIAGADRGLPPKVTAEEVVRARHPGCLYVQNVNRWIQRRASGNKDLCVAAPLGFHLAQLEKLPPELSPRLAYDIARRAGAFALDLGFQVVGEWTFPYEVDLARDLNGVGLLCFATYFSIADGSLAKVWRALGRSNQSFLDRLVVDTRICFLGNANPGAPLVVRVRQSEAAPDGPAERFDIQIVEQETQRLLAIVALDCEERGR